MPRPVFEIAGMHNDPLGLWTPAVSTPGEAGGVVSFSVSGETPTGPGQIAPSNEIPIFRVTLPADDDSAADAFAANEALLGRLNAALDSVPARLDGLVTRAQQHRQGAALSFDASAAMEEGGPEATLLALLGDAERESRVAAGEVSFGAGEEATSLAWEQAKAGFERLMEQVSREALHFAWVETNLEGSALARTAVGWTGDSRTVFVDGVEGPQAVLHERSLRIAIQTRGLRMRLFITIASGAAKVSALIASPAGAVLALPAVYQYVMQIVEQVKELQTIQVP